MFGKMLMKELFAESSRYLSGLERVKGDFMIVYRSNAQMLPPAYR